jgi:hypothetical protein
VMSARLRSLAVRETRKPSNRKGDRQCGLLN